VSGPAGNDRIGARAERARAFERTIGRLIIATTYVAVGLLGVGVVIMIASGISPLDGGPRLDPGALVGDLGRLAPAAFLWLGLVAVIATPVSRVVAAAVSSARTGDRWLLAVSVAILVVLAAAVASGLAAG
jgi:uncharacterized membrane protein